MRRSLKILAANPLPDRTSQQLGATRILQRDMSDSRPGEMPRALDPLSGGRSRLLRLWRARFVPNRMKVPQTALDPFTSLSFAATPTSVRVYRACVRDNVYIFIGTILFEPLLPSLHQDASPTEWRLEGRFDPGCFPQNDSVCVMVVTFVVSRYPSMLFAHARPRPRAVSTPGPGLCLAGCQPLRIVLIDHFGGRWSKFAVAEDWCLHLQRSRAQTLVSRMQHGAM